MLPLLTITFSQLLWYWVALSFAVKFVCVCHTPQACSSSCPAQIASSMWTCAPSPSTSPHKRWAPPHYLDYSYHVIPVLISVVSSNWSSPSPQVLTKDSVTVSVDGVVYYRVQNATLAVANITNADAATRLLAQTTLRNVLGTKNLAEILSDREEIAHSMQVLDHRILPLTLTITWPYTRTILHSMQVL